MKKYPSDSILREPKIQGINVYTDIISDKTDENENEKSNLTQKKFLFATFSDRKLLDQG